MFCFQIYMLDWGKNFYRAVIIVYVVSLALFVSQYVYPKLYFPLIGNKVVINQDACITPFGEKAQQWYLESDCKNLTASDGKIRKLNKGSHYEVDSVSNSNSVSLKSEFFLKLKYENSLITVSDNYKNIITNEGKSIQPVLRPIFYYLSNLMIYPVVPLMLFL